MAMGPVSFGQGDVSDNSVRRTGKGHLLDLLLALTEGEKLKPISMSVRVFSSASR
jgi:hypothetical protein